ncbi:hypothetical protein FI667_g2534, partial [Globisporangium splendens]
MYDPRSPISDDDTVDEYESSAGDTTETFAQPALCANKRKANALESETYTTLPPASSSVGCCLKKNGLLWRSGELKLTTALGSVRGDSLETQHRTPSTSMVNARPKYAELSISTVAAMAPPTHNSRIPDLDPPPSLPSPASFSSLASRGIRKSCATQQCLSPMATSISSSPRSTATASMMSPRVKSPRTPKNGDFPSSEAPLSPQQAPMSMETYFRLLKKSQVLEHLLAMNSYVHSSDEQLRKLQSEKAKTDSVQQKVLVELEKYQKQFVDVQRCFLELIETATTFCVKGEQLTLGATLNDAVAHAKRVVEERTVNDLQVATVPINCSDRKANGARPAPRSDDTMLSSSSSSLHSPSSSSSCVESQALVAVGQTRIKQMEQICAGYERQLVKCEAELTDAIHSTHVHLLLL